MIQHQCLTLSAEANALAKAKSATAPGLGRMGFRFESKGPEKHTFAPIEDLRVKDYVLQPVLGGVVVFVDPDSLAKGYGTDIHLDGREFVFVQSNRLMPTVADKTEQKKAEEKARRAAARASKGMKPGADKERVVRAVKEASLASDEAMVSNKKATATKKAARTSADSESAMGVKAFSGVASETKKPAKVSAKKPAAAVKKAV